MSKIHVLTENGGAYQVYIHTNVPVGVNAVANSWQACYLAAYSPITKMTIGNGLCQITSSEAASVAFASVLEFGGSISANADGSAPSSSGLDLFANSLISSQFSALQAQLKYFGYTQ